MSDVTILMTIPEITGSSTLIGHEQEEPFGYEGWIPVKSIGFQLARTHADTSASTPAPGEDGDPPPNTIETQVRPIDISRTCDNTTADILYWLSNKDSSQTTKSEVFIDFVHDSGLYYLRYLLKGVQLVRGELEFGDPDDATEKLTLTYDEVWIFQRRILESGQVDLESKSDPLVYRVPGAENES